jgi:hypothetical protein
MAQDSKTLIFIPVLVLAVCLQVIFIVADCRDTATGAAIEFSKAYFLLDASMANRLCSDLSTDEEKDWTADLIQRVSDEAGQRGFQPGMLKYSLEHIHTRTLHQDAASAEIHLSAVKRVCINPVFAWVAKLFRLGETQPVSATLELVKENGTWKVCGNPFELVQQS